MMSPIGNRGSSEAAGSWKTTPMFLRRARCSALGIVARSWPWMRSEPSAMVSRPRTDLAMVDLPEPDSPTRPRISPGATWKLTSWTTRFFLPRWSYSRWRFSASIAYRACVCVAVTGSGSATSRGSPRRGTAESSFWVYGCRACWSTWCTEPCSTSSPWSITHTRSAMSATTPMLCVMSRMPVFILFFRERSSSRISAWTVTSSAVVGSSAMITFGEQLIAIAMTMRWRWPPENWWGYCLRRVAASGMPTMVSSSTARLSASVP